MLWLVSESCYILVSLSLPCHLICLVYYQRTLANSIDQTKIKGHRKRPLIMIYTVYHDNIRIFYITPLWIYSWLLSRPRLSRITSYLEVKIWSLPKHLITAYLEVKIWSLPKHLITAYLEVKIWSLPKHENKIIGKKYWGKEEQFLHFSTIFSI